MTPLGKPKRKRWIDVPSTPDTVPEEWPSKPAEPIKPTTPVPEKV